MINKLRPFAFFILVLTSTSTFACRDLESRDQLFEEADTVLEGHISSISVPAMESEESRESENSFFNEFANGARVIRLAVTRSVKGNAVAVQEIRGQGCGYFGASLGDKVVAYHLGNGKWKLVFVKS